MTIRFRMTLSLLPISTAVTFQSQAQRTSYKLFIIMTNGDSIAFVGDPIKVTETKAIHLCQQNENREQVNLDKIVIGVYCTARTSTGVQPSYSGVKDFNRNFDIQQFRTTRPGDIIHISLMDLRRTTYSIPIQ